MSSTFDAHFEQSGLPQLQALFGEKVTIAPQGSGTRIVRAIVEIDEPLRDASGETPSVLTGVMYLPASQRSALITDNRLPLKILARGYTWYVTEVGLNEGGQFGIGVRTELADNESAIDLQGNQHRYE
jgi:hypothetical protein